MKKILLFLSAVMFLFFPMNIHAEEMVTVRLFQNIEETSELDIMLKGGYFSLNPFFQFEDGVNYSLSVKKGKLVIKGNGQKQVVEGSVYIVPEKYDVDHQILINNHPYLGAMEFAVENNQFIRPINQLPLEDYLKGVVPLEVYPSWPIETLKAQALAARTYAVAHINDKMDDTIRFQVYGGYDWKASTTKAVNETKGEVITHKDKLINAFYSASNGGVTESNANVWGGNPEPYFPIKEDPYDPTHPWEYSLHQEQISLDNVDWTDSKCWDETEEVDQKITNTMKKKLQKNGYPGDIKIVSIPTFELSKDQYDSKRSRKGSITIQFLHRLYDGTVMLEEYELKDVEINRIRPLIGGDLFKSYLIDSLDFQNKTYTMQGRGYGHGVGMSQWGASIMGQKGKSYQEIIQHYFPGTTISKY
ncbi:SpoIID/LytB domain-containing protein [Bacillus suaedaesalsae]|uniref:SpoIID/LytB domain-containing protein n=1 Tax=Bacillus suaedaesalsae TaxID=2810349 RepID=A0ABS2DLW7_9BACI|nr:SpoIID/LytB domain-containing protein [Bacillus suaedaesalsae]MBM6619495.1 SpoIID/LytB domain-containing protein [Bacillus suaedaesalsae]